MRVCSLSTLSRTDRKYLIFLASITGGGGGGSLHGRDAFISIRIPTVFFHRLVE